MCIRDRKYPGYPGGDAIFLARAKALEGPWEIYSINYDTGEYFWDQEQKPYFWYPVLTCQDVWYDSWHVGDPSVVYKAVSYTHLKTDSEQGF